MHPIEKTRWWRLVAMAAVLIGAFVGCLKVYEFYVTQPTTLTTASGPPPSPPANVSNDAREAVHSWEMLQAERDAKTKAEAERQTVAQARVSKYWRTVARGDTLEKVYAVLGEPDRKPRKDARTGKAIDGILIYGGENELSVNVWHENEKVKYVVAGVFRQIEKKPDLVAKNWQAVKVGDSTEAVLRRLGGPSSGVCYDVDTDEIADQYLHFEGAPDLRLMIRIEKSRVVSIDAERQ